MKQHNIAIHVSTKKYNGKDLVLCYQIIPIKHGLQCLRKRDAIIWIALEDVISIEAYL